MLKGASIYFTAHSTHHTLITELAAEHLFACQNIQQKVKVFKDEVFDDMEYGQLGMDLFARVEFPKIRDFL